MIEDVKKDSLTDAEKADLILRTDKSFNAKETNSGNCKSLPLIEEGPCDIIRYSLHISSDQAPSDLPDNQPASLAQKLIESYLISFSQDADGTGTKATLDQITEWQNSAFPSDGDKDRAGIRRDAASMGTFIVFEAFDLQFQHMLRDNLRRIESNDVNTAFNNLKNRIRMGYESTAEIIKDRKIAIPKEQVSLGVLVEEFANRFKPYSMEIESGANLAFGIIGELWSKLKLGASSQKA